MKLTCIIRTHTHFRGEIKFINCRERCAQTQTHYLTSNATKKTHKVINETEEGRNSNKVRKQQEQEVKMTTKGPKQLDYLSILSQLRRGRSDWPRHWCLLTGSD